MGGIQPWRPVVDTLMEGFQVVWNAERNRMGWQLALRSHSKALQRVTTIQLS